MTILVPWILKALFVLVKTRRGRKLVVATGLAAIELAQSERAQKLYAKARASIDEQALKRRARRLAQAIRP
jgi:hypothetical protein